MKNCYADPTANTAIANVDRERRKKERQERPCSRPNRRPVPIRHTPPPSASHTAATDWLIARWPVPAEKE